MSADREQKKVLEAVQKKGADVAPAATSEALGYAPGMERGSDAVRAAYGGLENIQAKTNGAELNAADLVQLDGNTEASSAAATTPDAPGSATAESATSSAQ